ncbi:MAG: hypothetical protein IAF08_14190 [Rhizobacter sp.]|nr:hypothetical protein [Chlorobiales bacterium]
MPASPLSLDTWRQLYDAASQLKTLSPWQWMEETQIFGVEHPDTGASGFVSIMGMAGEHYAVSLYLGAEGLHKFLRLVEAKSADLPMVFLEMPQLQVSFENRSDLEPADLALLKQLGIKFRGRDACVKFRSYRPGFMPWYLEEPEAAFLIQALEQVLAVAPRVKNTSDLLDPTGNDELLVRTLNRSTSEWQDERWTINRSPPVQVVYGLDKSVLSEALALTKRAMKVEMDLFMSPMPVQEKASHPYFPYVLLTADTGTTALLGSRMFVPKPSVEAMWMEIPEAVLELFTDINACPSHISVSSKVLYDLLMPLAEQLDIKLRFVSILPQMQEVKLALFDHFR